MSFYSLFLTKSTLLAYLKWIIIRIKGIFNLWEQFQGFSIDSNI